MADFSSDYGLSSGTSEKAEAAELQRLIAIEQQKAQFQAQVTYTEIQCSTFYEEHVF